MLNCCTLRPCPLSFLFFFNDTATTEIYTLSLHDALPILLVEELAGLAREGRRVRLETGTYACQPQGRRSGPVDPRHDNRDAVRRRVDDERADAVEVRPRARVQTGASPGQRHGVARGAADLG